MLRKVQVSGTVYIVDDEIIGDERCMKHVSGEAVVGSEQSAELVSFDESCGGEVRVKIDLSVTALPNGNIKVVGKAILFEGVSDETTDVEDSVDIELIVSRDRSRTYYHKLVNEGIGGGDYAEIKLNFNNISADLLDTKSEKKMKGPITRSQAPWIDEEDIVPPRKMRRELASLGVNREARENSVRLGSGNTLTVKVERWWPTIFEQSQKAEAWVTNQQGQSVKANKLNVTMYGFWSNGSDGNKTVTAKSEHSSHVATDKKTLKNAPFPSGKHQVSAWATTEPEKTPEQVKVSLG